MMTNLQLYLAVCVPCVTILVALIVSRVQVWNIRAEMAGLRSDVRSDLAEIRSQIASLNSLVMERMGLR